WVVLRHAEAVQVAEDAQTFSSAASRFLQVPNGLDGAEHAAIRAATDPFFAPEEMARLAPVLRTIAVELVEELMDSVGPAGTEVDAVAALGAVFAVRGQTVWLGWPEELEPELLDWMVENHEASRSGDLARTAAGAIVDELLRIDDPFVSNRRVTTCPVTLAGQEIAAGERVMLHWTSINRDERVFEDPDAVAPEANAAQNLVYGTGPHVCPGRELATLELVTLLRELLAVADVHPAETPGEREIAPVGGWAHAPVVLVPRG